jgi:hypothetical protein
MSSCAKMSAGANKPALMRNPSEKYWLKKKLFISRVWSDISSQQL